MIFDIGANMGIFSLVAAALNPTAEVFAFEPVSKVFTLLTENRRLNHLENLHVFDCALAEHDGEIEIYVPLGQKTPSTASTRAGFRRHAKAVTVQALKGDTFFNARGRTGLDLIKIDTESTEPAAFGGMIETLSRHGPAIIREVLAGGAEDELMDLLPELGCKFWQITDKGLIPREAIVGDDTFQFSNYLFRPKPLDGVA